MNYGEQFVEIYNDEFLKLKKDLIDYLEGHFNSDFSFSALFDNFLKELSKLLKTQSSKDELLMICRIDFFYRYIGYTKNAAVNTINKDIYKKYINNLELESSKIKDYEEFTISLAKLTLYEDFKYVFKKYKNQIENGFEKQDVSKILKIKKQTNAEYLLYYFDPKKEPLIKDDLKTDFEENLFKNPFTKDEKVLLMFYLLNYERLEEKKLSIYELTLVLKLTSGGFEGEKLVKERGTLYDKINKGLNHYAVCNRKSILKVLLKKIKKFNVGKFEEYLSHQFHNL
jgi:hypothetical protein